MQMGIQDLPIETVGGDTVRVADSPIQLKTVYLRLAL
jgi:hypothetical protein